MHDILLSVYHLHGLLRSQWLSPSEIEAIQQRKLRAILLHAYENVDYYHQLFDSAGVRPERIKDRQDLLRIPITTKRQLQSLPSKEITPRSLEIGESTTLKTSGSTGMPLDIILSKEDLRFRGAVFNRTFLAHGYRLGDKVVLISNYRSSHKQKHWYEYLGMRRSYSISAFGEIDDQIVELRRLGPDILIGVPSGLLAVAKTIEKKGIKDISPRIILSGGEILTPHTREFLNAAFGTTTVDLYNSSEFGSIAWECKHRAGYHINADSLIVEVIQNGRKALAGERGEIVITSLSAHAMPFVRYHLGDIGVLSDRRCPCGRGLPLLERVEGKTDDDIKLPGGGRLSPYAIRNRLEFIPGISQFRVLQKEKNEFWVYLVKGENFCPTTLQQIEGELKNILGDLIDLHIQVMDKIPFDPSGKLRAVISNI